MSVIILYCPIPSKVLWYLYYCYVKIKITFSQQQITIYTYDYIIIMIIGTYNTLYKYLKAKKLLIVPIHVCFEYKLYYLQNVKESVFVFFNRKRRCSQKSSIQNINRDRFMWIVYCTADIQCFPKYCKLTCFHTYLPVWRSAFMFSITRDILGFKPFTPVFPL